MCVELKDIYTQMWPAYPKPAELEHSTLTLWRDPSEVRIEVAFNGKAASVAGWQLHHSPGLYVVSNAWVLYSSQGKGIGKCLAQFRVDAFRELKRSGGWEDAPCDDINMICRVSPRNAKQIHILEACGWTQLSSTIWEVL